MGSDHFCQSPPNIKEVVKESLRGQSLDRLSYNLQFTSYTLVVFNNDFQC